MDDQFNGVARRRRRRDQGFTLIELLVVIAVLSTLAGVVIFNVAGLKNRGNLAACRTDRQSIQTAVDAYYTDHLKTYPPDVTTLVPRYLHSQPIDVGKVWWSAATNWTVSSDIPGCTT